ncbi:MAG: right-handed parallel beta-helix repeat-containing protein [Salinivirgaceae bacterium]|jgi:hypothetical protein|nr:right-handed parallel beta-helix repeat-containing protein [Salinivirgaceae bacterium]
MKKKILVLNFSLILFALLAGTTAFSRNYYVATTGNNDNSGTKENPYATIDKAATIAQAGDSVIIKPGTYIQSAEITLSNSGTPNAPIVFYSEVNCAAIIDGQSTVPTIASRHGLLYVTGDNIVIDGFRIQNSGFFGVLMTSSSSNITVKNCYTYFTGASGICAAGATNITVLNNTVQKACHAPGGLSVRVSECITMASVTGFEVAYNTVFDRLTNLNSGGEGIDAKNLCSNGKIHHNVVYDLFSVGIYVDAYQKNITNVEVYANKVYNTGSGITIASEEGGIVNNVKVHDNLVYNMGKVGIRIAGYLNNGPIQDIDIYQNTIYNCGWKGNYENCGLLIEASNTANYGFRIRNNVISGCPMQIKSNSSQNFPVTVDNNLFYGSNGYFSSQTTITNTINSDPQFVDAANLDFRLKSTSPAIDKATGNLLSENDILGFSRGAKPDLGAFEYNATSGVHDLKTEKKTLSIYPNPATDYFTINRNNETNCFVRILNLNGQVVDSFAAAEKQIRMDSSKLKPGIYLVEVKDKEQISCDRIIVN